MEEAIRELKTLKAKRIFIQYPEGIKKKIQDIAKRLEREGMQVVICTEPCYGACDIRDEDALRIGCDAILHIGHEPVVEKTKIPVVYWEYFLDVNPLPALEKEFDKLKHYQKIGLITSLQFVKTIPIVKKILEERGKEVFVHKSLQYPGQVLGCRLDAGKAIEDKVDCFLCISAGKFYGLGMVLCTEKPMLNLDLERGTIESLENEKKKIQKIIAWNKSALKDARKVGILVSWKKGQFKPPLDLKKKLEKEGKEVYLLAMDEVTPEKIEGLELDVLISTACPRIGIDDLSRYKIPVLNSNDIFKK
jgi:2-(3-amino-3-carboxypropyl)histidine synthase